MKRPSIYDPPVPSMNEHRHDQRPDPRAESGRQNRPSLIVKLSVKAQIVNNKVSAKRKHAEDASTQRVTRPKLTDDRIVVEDPTASATGNNRTDNGSAVTEPVLSTFNDVASASVLPTSRSYSKQKPAVKAPVGHGTSRAGPSESNQLVALVSKPKAVQVAKTGVPQKATGKRKSAARVPIQQQVSPQIGSSSSKKTVGPTKESKRARQPQGACKSCRTRHQKCDRMHPTCGRCVRVGSSCEYQKSKKATVPPSVPHASGPPGKQALPPIQAAAKDTNHELNQSEEPVTISPEASRQNIPVKRQLPDSPLKKATPTAASTRAPRTKHAPNSRASPQKQK